MMAPTGQKPDMTLEREVEIIHARQDEQGRLITQHGERLNIQSQRVDRLYLVVLGDEENQIKGLLHRTGDLEKLTAEIQQWRRDIMIWAKAGVAILAVTGLGTWLPYIEVFLKFLGGH